MSFVAIWLQAYLLWRCAYFQTLSWNDTIFVVDWDILYKLCGSANKWSKGFIFSGKIWWQFFSCYKTCSKHHTRSTATPKYTLPQRIVILAFPGFEPSDSPVWPVRSEETLEGLADCVTGDMKIAMKLCTSFGDKIGRASSWLFGLLRLFHEMRPDYFVISWDHFEFSLKFTRGINRGYYMAAQGYEIALRVIKNISRVSAPFELFYDAQRRFVFVQCYVVKLFSWVAWLSRTLSTFLDYSWHPCVLIVCEQDAVGAYVWASLY